MKLKTLLATSVLALSTQAGVIETGEEEKGLRQGGVHVPAERVRILDHSQQPDITFEQGAFSLTRPDGTVQTLSAHSVRGVPGDVTEDQFSSFLAHGFLRVKTGLEGEDYDLEATVDGKGGIWPLLAYLGVEGTLATSGTAIILRASILFPVVRKLLAKKSWDYLMGYMFGKAVDKGVDALLSDHREEGVQTFSIILNSAEEAYRENGYDRALRRIRPLIAMVNDFSSIPTEKEKRDVLLHNIIPTFREELPHIQANLQKIQDSSAS